MYAPLQRPESRKVLYDGFDLRSLGDSVVDRVIHIVQSRARRYPSDVRAPLNVKPDPYHTDVRLVQP